MDQLPKTPIEVFRVSPELLQIVAKAKRFGWWDLPLEDAATDWAERSGNDREYWYYKSTHPIIRTTQNVSDALFLNDKSVVRLPVGFERKASITVGAAGDLIQASGLENSRDLLFEHIEDILLDADVSFANYESVVADDETVKNAIGDGRSSMMCCNYSQYSALTEHIGKRFSVLNAANNHSIDLGIEGLQTTQALMAKDGILDIGIPRNLSQYGKGKVLVKNGIKLGFVSATFGLNDLELPKGSEHRVHASKLMSRFAPPDLELLRSQIEDCKKQGCDFIVASLHWGYEFEFFPRYKQIEAAHTLVEEGVDLILGHHPHVIQPVEYFRPQRDPGRLAVIAYSLGSLTWDWYTAPHLILSMVLNMRLAKGLMDGENRTYIESIDPVPVFRSIFRRDDNPVMRIEKLGESLKRAENTNASLMQMKKYVDLCFGESLLST
ncbi:CapA family protein [Rhizobium mongolense]|uniref:CapA family protein n=1 Tax=Rhizobium mongolense TaxID=57676 RepID=UPI003557B4AE